MEKAIQSSNQEAEALECGTPVEEAYDGMSKLDMLMGAEVAIGMGPCLVYIWNQRRHQVPITGVTTVGRSALCDIQIPASVVSRQHFQLEPTENGILLHPVGSVNQCTLNGSQVETSVQLTFGDLIAICGIYFLYVE